ncbi:putative Serine acetyltransferase [metagenome]|uniref:Putative Serine acetyltransferase n=1 Tax=metagenome TaxID=256318 RepID=A0A2P2C6L6_9ZZZZ
MPLGASTNINESVVSRYVVAEYRFGNWVHTTCPSFIKRPLWAAYRILNLFTRLVTTCEVPATATIGPGLRLDHNGNGIVIHQEAVIGSNARIFHQVTLGVNSFAGNDNYGPPRLGNNVYIGAGAKLIGNITVGDNVRIGANAVVTRDIPSNSVAVGVPAVVRPIRDGE